MVLRSLVAVLVAGLIAAGALIGAASGSLLTGFLDQRGWGIAGPERTIGILYLAMNGVLFLIAAGVAFVLAWRSRKHSGQILGLFVALTGAMNLPEILDLLPAFSDLNVDQVPVVLVASGFVFLWFASEYGREVGGASPTGKWILTLGIVALSLTTGTLLWNSEVLMLASVPFVSIGLALVLYAVVMGLTLLRIAGRTASTLERQRVAWIFNGMLIGFVFAVCGLAIPDAIAGATTGSLDSPITDRLMPVAYSLQPLVLVTAIAVSVFYKGSIDSELMLRRSFIYSVVSVVFVFLFAGLEGLLENLLDQRAALPKIVSIFISGGVTALIVAPFHERLRRLASRILPKPQPSEDGQAVPHVAPVASTPGSEPAT
jgi:hypothetical protein